MLSQHPDKSGWFGKLSPFPLLRSGCPPGQRRGEPRCVLVFHHNELWCLLNKMSWTSLDSRRLENIPYLELTLFNPPSVQFYNLLKKAQPNIE
jgi:hypothetical protein